MQGAIDLITSKGRTYGPSWKRRGGAGAWFTLVRPWDRLEKMVAEHGGDIFAAIEAAPEGGDGTVLDAVRDCRNYLSLIEAEMVARGVVVMKERMPEEAVERAHDAAMDAPTGGDSLADLFGSLRTVIRNWSRGTLRADSIDFDGSMVPRIKINLARETHPQ